MNIPEHIFRSYDIRGLLEEVTTEIAQSVGVAIVQKTNAKSVIIGRDMRETSPELMDAAIKGVLSQGANVIDIGMCTTSMFNYAVSSQEDVDAGLMITASHNPPEYNGIKSAYSSGLPISGKDILKAIYDIKPVNIKPGNKSDRDILSQYITSCIEEADLPDLSGTKIVVDYGNGMGSVSVKPLLEKLGVEVISLYPDPDSSFPNHEANPAKEETLSDVKDTVLREEADFGVALDGDADRVGFIDNEGVSIAGDLMLALLARDVLQKHPKATITTSPNQSWITNDTIEEHGGNTYSCKIGRTNVIAAMKESGAILGGEVSSHFFYKEFSNLESVDYTIVIALGLWRRSGGSFADLVRDLRIYFNSGEVNIEVDDKDGVLRNIKETYETNASKVDMLDGIRCEFGREYWFIVRPSNTEPLLRLIVEAKSQKIMEEKRDEIVDLIKGHS
jgi:phosphomannomutase